MTYRELRPNKPVIGRELLMPIRMDQENGLDVLENAVYTPVYNIDGSRFWSYSHREIWYIEPQGVRTEALE